MDGGKARQTTRQMDGLTGRQMKNGCMANERGLWTDEQEKWYNEEEEEKKKERKKKKEEKKKKERVHLNMK